MKDAVKELHRLLVSLIEDDYCPPGIIYEALRLRDKYGWTVANRLAFRNLLPEQVIDADVLKIRKECDGCSVAHDLAWHNFLPARFLTGDILLMRDENGLTVLHKLAESGFYPCGLMFDKYLDQADNRNKTVRSILVESGRYPASYEETRSFLVSDSSDRRHAAEMYLRNEFKDLASAVIFFLRDRNRTSLNQLSFSFNAV